MLVFLHPQDFSDTPTREQHKFDQAITLCQAVFQVEFAPQEKQQAFNGWPQGKQ